jgi:hypothetical protein
MEMANRQVRENPEPYSPITAAACLPAFPLNPESDLPRPIAKPFLDHIWDCI